MSDPRLVFKALADPTRRRILEYLREGNLNAGEIAERFDMTKLARTERRKKSHGRP